MNKKYIHLTKISKSSDPICQPGGALYQYGDVNHDSLPIDYTLEGYLIQGLIVGKPVIVDRRKRNDIVMRGEFVSTPVVRLTDNGFETLNSVYKIEYLAAPELKE